jgi:hypothetical protein
MPTEPVKLREIVVIISASNGALIRAGNSLADAYAGRFRTDGTVPASEIELFDQVFRKLLTALHGGGLPITLNIRNKVFIVKDPQPSTDIKKMAWLDSPDPHKVIDELVLTMPNFARRLPKGIELDRGEA